MERQIPSADSNQSEYGVKVVPQEKINVVLWQCEEVRARELGLFCFAIRNGLSFPFFIFLSLSPPPFKKIMGLNRFNCIVKPIIENSCQRAHYFNIMSNPRYANGNLRRKHRARLKAMGNECAICRGRLGPIDYTAPSDSAHPLSFVVDEIKPVSRWKEFGYRSARDAAEDWNNLQAAHYYCNAMKSNRVEGEEPKRRRLAPLKDGKW